MDGVSVLFPAAAGVYEEDRAALAVNAMAREAVARSWRDCRAGRKVRVLEAGAGTGGTTPHLLSVLPPSRSEYCFTDVWAYFTEQAKERFRSYGFLRADCWISSGTR